MSNEFSFFEEKKRCYNYLNRIPIGLFFSEADGTVIAGNDFLAKMLGYKTASEVEKKSLSDFFVNSEELIHLLSQFNSENPEINEKLQIKRKDGSKIWGEIYLNATFSSEGKLIAFDGCVREITQEKEQEDNSNMYKNAFYFNADAIFIAELETGMIVNCSREAENLIGYTKKEILSMKFKDLHPVEEISVMEDAFQKHASGERFVVESQVLTKSKRKIPVSINSSIIQIGKKKYLQGIFRDLTDRKEIEIKLLQKKEKLQHYLDIAGVILVVINKEGIVELVNRKGCEVLGYSEKEIIGKNWIECFIPKDEQKLVKDVFSSMIQGDIELAEQFENPVLTKDNKIRTIAWKNKYLKNEKGDIVSTLSSGEDITEKKEIFAKLKENENKYRTLFENANDAIFLSEFKDSKIEGNFLDVNSVACERYGYSREEFLQMTPLDITPNNLIKITPQVIKKIDNEKHLVYEREHLTKDGSVFPVEISTQLFKLGDKQVFLSIARDITERKEAELKLIESERFLRTIIDNSPLGYSIDSNQKNIKIINNALIDMLGYSEAELLENDLLFFTPEEYKEQSIEVFNKLKNREEKLNFLEKEYIKKDGTKIPVRVGSWGLFNKEGEMVTYVGTVEDITERKKIDNLRKEAYTQIERNILNFSILVDQIRNPLAVILNAAELKNPDFFNKIVEHAEKISNITQIISDSWEESEKFRLILQKELLEENK